jgi:hypothetical protein
MDTQKTRHMTSTVLLLMSQLLHRLNGHTENQLPVLLRARISGMA